MCIRVPAAAEWDSDCPALGTVYHEIILSRIKISFLGLQQYKGTKPRVDFLSTFKIVMEMGDGAEMQRVKRETRVCAKVALEPENGITGKSDRRREKVLLSDAGK